jgi:hypothetical protein
VAKSEFFWFVMSSSSLILLLVLIPAAEAEATTTFQSSVDGIRVQVPSGWVVEDVDDVEVTSLQTDEVLGSELLVILCPQSETLPKIGGGFVCPAGADNLVWIERHSDLKSRPEFGVLTRENKSITISDFLAYLIQKDEEELSITDHRLLKNFDRTVNVTDPQTNQTVAMAPAKYVEMSYLNWEGERVDRDFELLVLSNDDGGNTGYFLIIDTPGSPERLPPQHQQIFDSFELLVNDNNTTTSTTR